MAKRRRERVRVIVRRSRDKIAYDEKGMTSLVVGGLAGFLFNTQMVKESDWLKRHWYALPIALLLVGYLLAKRGNAYGKTLMGLGAYMFMNNFMNQPKEGQQDTAGGWTNQQIPAGQWVVTPDGQWVLMPGNRQVADAAAPALTQGRPADTVASTIADIYDRV